MPPWTSPSQPVYNMSFKQGESAILSSHLFNCFFGALWRTVCILSASMSIFTGELLWLFSAAFRVVLSKQGNDASPLRMRGVPSAFSLLLLTTPEPLRRMPAAWYYTWTSSEGAKQYPMSEKRGVRASKNAPSKNASARKGIVWNWSVANNCETELCEISETHCDSDGSRDLGQKNVYPKTRLCA